MLVLSQRKKVAIRVAGGWDRKFDSHGGEAFYTALTFDPCVSILPLQK